MEVFNGGEFVAHKLLTPSCLSPRQTPYGQRQNYIPSLGSELRENLAWLLLSTFTGSATLGKVLNLSELQFQCL